MAVEENKQQHLPIEVTRISTTNNCEGKKKESYQKRQKKKTKFFR